MKILNKNTSILTALLFLVTLGANSAPWIKEDDTPDRFFKSWNAKLSELKVSSQSESEVWSGYYYPNSNGGIALRWEGVTDFLKPAQETNPHYYKKLKKKEVLKMSESELNKLSAAEKYDIYKKEFKFPTVKSEKERTHPTHPTWIGICNGWSSATVKYDGEPQTFEHTLKNGKKMTFYSSDIKALLAYYEARFVSPNSLPKYMGKRCNSRDKSLPECSGMNPGALHIALTNRIGIERKALIMDLDRTYEVWNHPVYAYDSKLEKINDRKYKASTLVWYLQESAPFYNALQNPITLGITYDYTLELDKGGNIVGGEWISEHRVDFVWDPQDEINFSFPKSKYFSDIYKIYKGSLEKAGKRPYPLAGMVQEAYFEENLK